MVNVSLTEKELELLKMSINHCLETCAQGGDDKGCKDCGNLRAVLDKISQA